MATKTSMKTPSTEKPVFAVGAVTQIYGYDFKIHSIGPRGRIILKAVK